MTAVDIGNTFSSKKELYSQECCCCLKGNCVKDIYTEYYDTEAKEMYSEMIQNTFSIDIKIKHSNIIHKQYICDPCIKQLKSAYSLKCNILKNHKAMAEKMYKLNDQSKNDIKCETIKDDDDEDAGDSEGFYNDLNTSGLKLKSEIIRKRTKLKEHKEDDDNSQKSSKTQKNKNKAVCKSTTLRKDSLKIISNSSIWVFNWSEGRYRCYCCREPFSDIELLKNHTETHKIEEIEAKIQNSENNLVKVEVSNIDCKICGKNVNNLPTLIEHFKIHNIMITEHILVPMKIDDFSCQICNDKFSKFYFLNLHMIKHYQTVICDKCGAGFYKKKHLKQHIEKNHNPNGYKPKPRQALKCHYCSERFKQFHLRIIHMTEKHGLEKPQFPCNLCEKTYLTKGILNAHIKNSHYVRDRVFECDVCMKKFDLKNTLVRHKDTHSEGINHTCSICNHGFKLFTSLKRHIKLKHKS